MWPAGPCRSIRPRPAASARTRLHRRRSTPVPEPSLSLSCSGSQLSRSCSCVVFAMMLRGAETPMGYGPPVHHRKTCDCSSWLDGSISKESVQKGQSECECVFSRCALQIVCLSGEPRLCRLSRAPKASRASFPGSCFL